MTSLPLPELLVYAPAWERLRTQLDGRVKPLTIDDSGVIWDDRTVIAPGIASPTVAWANRDLYMRGPVKEFMVACLKSRSLRWFQSSAAGFEHPVFAKLMGNGVALTNSNASAVPIAEFVFAQVLQAFHPAVERLESQRARNWKQLEFRDIYGTTWFVHGMGHVGRAVAERAQAFGARVIGCRRSISGDEPADEMVSTDDYLDAVKRADVVVMTTSLNAGNVHIVNDTFLSAMKPNSIFVNIGRGGLVDEGALLKALDLGRPAIAILDVVENEPLPDDSPLWNHPNIRLTAHCAGASEGTSLRGDEIFLDNLTRFLNGEPLRLQVHNIETVGS